LAGPNGKSAHYPVLLSGETPMASVTLAVG